MSAAEAASQQPRSGAVCGSAYHVTISKAVHKTPFLNEARNAITSSLLKPLCRLDFQWAIFSQQQELPKVSMNHARRDQRSTTQSLKYALKSLSDDAREPSSILNRKGIQRKGELDDIISSCKSTMMDLQIIIDRRSCLRPDHRGNITRIWHAYRVGSIDLDSYRGKLTFHTSTIGVFLLSLQGPTMARIETKLDKIYARMIGDDIAQARQSTASSASTVSILSQIDTNEDEVFAMLKAELLTEDISMARILAHKDDIVTHMKKLVSNGSAGDTLNEKQRGAPYKQTTVPSPSIDSVTLQSSVLEVHKELKASRRGHEEVKAQLESRELQADKTYNEKLALLEKDYQSKLIYVKGIKMILQRMGEEIKERKAESRRL